ncbi:hypothetical protein DW095_10695 [Bacteroides sp. AM07-16]|nr:hypothetical protein DW095_10695 [Bacteroides sp. AM07-16]
MRQSLLQAALIHPLPSPVIAGFDPQPHTNCTDTVQDEMADQVRQDKEKQTGPGVRLVRPMVTSLPSREGEGGVLSLPAPLPPTSH